MQHDECEIRASGGDSRPPLVWVPAIIMSMCQCVIHALIVVVIVVTLVL